MANLDFRKNVKEMSFDEIMEEVNQLKEEHRKLLALPTKEFLSEETRNKLDEIHKRMIELISPYKI